MDKFSEELSQILQVVGQSIYSQTPPPEDTPQSEKAGDKKSDKKDDDKKDAEEGEIVK